MLWALGLIIALVVLYLLRHYIFTLNRLFGRQRHPYVDIEAADWRTVTLLARVHLALFVPLQYLAHALLQHRGSLLFMPLLFWMLGLPLDILVLVALFSWAASWQTLPQALAGRAPQLVPAPASPRSRAPRPTMAVALPLAAVALWAPDGNARLHAARPWRDQWRFEVGRAARFDDEGIGLSMSYRRHLRRDTRWSVGASTGTSDVLFPRWRIDLGQPGDITSRSGGFGLMWNHWRRWAVDTSYEAGDVSYLLVAPGNALVAFHSSIWRMGASAYLGERWGIAARYEQRHADVYDLWTVGGIVFVEW